MIYIGVLIIVVSPVQEEQPPPPPVQQQPIVQEPPARMQREPGMIYVSCEMCTWEGGYESTAAAKMGLGAHRGWCKRGHGRKPNPFG